MRGGSVCERVFGRVSNFSIRVRGRVVLCAYAGFICVLSLVLSGCEPVVPEGYEAVTLPISIGLPVGEVYSPQTAPERCPSEEGTMARAFGDPGTTERFAIPQYIYFFIVKENDDDTWEVWATDTRSVAEESGATDEAKREAWEARWTKTHQTGLYATVGDSIYRFDEEMHLLLPSPRFNGRVYAVASAVPLKFSPKITVGSSLSELQSMRFRFDGGTEYDTKVKENLQNIYSSPYNYNYNGAYYGSFSKDTKVPHINLLLYHVAAKVDLMWNVAEGIRGDVKLSYIAAEHLYDGPCYVFKPTENMIAGAAYESGYTMPILSVLSPGTQWNGRAYFYAIPYRKNNNVSGDYPLQLRLLKNGDDPSAATSYYKTIVDTKVPTVWTSWIRGQITIKNKEYNYPTP